MSPQLSATSAGPRAGDMLTVLDRWVGHGWLRPLDLSFARFLAREVGDAPALLLLAAALASHQLGRGHACLDLAQTLDDPSLALSLPPEGATPADDPAPLPAELLDGVALGDWQAALRHPEIVADGAGATPLVCVGTRLYLRRYWQYEQDVGDAIERRLAQSATPGGAIEIDPLRNALDVLFPSAPPGGGPDWQKIACALAARSAFSIITGGPGTGKTTTVVKLLALLQSVALGKDGKGRVLRIRLAAPTGKAAARLNESVAGAVAGLPLSGLPAADAVRASIPLEVSTLHRLLGTRPDSRHFRHDAGNPLSLEVLVVDEASMVDLEMMAAVLAALPSHARLVLLGDKDQLASVEAGAVLGELCRRAQDAHYTAATRQWLKDVVGCDIDAAFEDRDGTPLDQSITMLRHSHRFDADSGIGRLAAAVNAGSAPAVREILDGGFADLRELPLEREGAGALERLVIGGSAVDHGAAAPALLQGYRHYLGVIRDRQPAPNAGQDAIDDWARAVLVAHTRFQVLCALRRGPWGVDGLNQRIAAALHAEGLLPATGGWYSGRPVLVTRNDYGLGLMNGDIGIVLGMPEQGPGGGLRVAFPAADGCGAIKWVLPNRLQAVDTVFALTVHKSQGSEFAHVALLLPGNASPILTRELLYTGITRARNGLTLVSSGTRDVLDEAVARRVLRASGLSGD